MADKKIRVGVTVGFNITDRQLQVTLTTEGSDAWQAMFCLETMGRIESHCLFSGLSLVVGQAEEDDDSSPVLMTCIKLLRDFDHEFFSVWRFFDMLRERFEAYEDCDEFYPVVENPMKGYGEYWDEVERKEKEGRG